MDGVAPLAAGDGGGHRREAEGHPIGEGANGSAPCKALATLRDEETEPLSLSSVTLLH